MRLISYVIGLAGLCACSSVDVTSMRSQFEALDLEGDTRRAIDAAYRDTPFDSGVISLVANEHGDLHTYQLTSCGENRICGGTGHVGLLERTQDFFVVTGAYPGRVFFLLPGGSGYLNWRGENRDLAWN